MVGSKEGSTKMDFGGDSRFDLTLLALFCMNNVCTPGMTPVTLQPMDREVRQDCPSACPQFWNFNIRGTI